MPAFMRDLIFLAILGTSFTLLMYLGMGVLYSLVSFPAFWQVAIVIVLSAFVTWCLVAFSGILKWVD